ncbi:unnamed protein product [Peniophora sp. CBMAI 1063]|nr:unnamed protein product [Peniophora sp. CBMAI 1063]
MPAREPPSRTIMPNQLRFSPDNDRFWSQVTEARLQALSDSSTQGILRELERSQKAHEEMLANLRHRFKLRNGRIGKLPLEIIALIFWWLSEMDPMGEVDVDAPCEPDLDEDEDSQGSADSDGSDEGDTGGGGSDSGEGNDDDDGVENSGDGSGEISDSNHDEDDSEDDGSECAWSRASSELSADIRVTYAIGWVRVSWVCHLWREIALAHPALWATVPMHLPLPWISALLERSKHAPLTVVFTGEEVEEVYFLPEHASWLKRARTIIYHHLPTGRLTQLLESCATPLLKHLDIVDSCDVFPASMLESERFNALESLSIQALDRLPRPDHGFTPIFLTSLRLGTVSTFLLNGASTPLIPSAEDFLALLRTLSRLELLEMHGCLPLHTTAAHSARLTPVALPRLQHVALTGHYSGCAFFLRHVDCPSKTTFRIDYLDVADEAVDGLTLGHIAPRQALEALSITCVTRYMFTCVIQGSFAPKDVLVEQPGGIGLSSDADVHLSLTPQLGLPSPEVKLKVPGVFRALCTQLGVDRVRTLVLDIDSSFNAGPLGLDTVDDQEDAANPVHPWNALEWIKMLDGAHNLCHLQLVSRPPVERARKSTTIVDFLLALNTSSEFLPTLRILDLVDLRPNYAPLG